MSFGAEHESPRGASGPESSDAVTFSFGDLERRLFGLARVGISGGHASGLAIVFAEGEPVIVRAEGDAEPGARWEDVHAAGLRTGVAEPFQAWTIALDAGEEGGFELGFEAAGPSAELAADSDVGRAGGMQGYEHVCRVQGTLTIGGERHELDCRGQRGHLWGAPDWERIALARTLGAWFDDGEGLVVSAVRPAGAQTHDAEALGATLIGAEAATAVFDPRLSTGYDGEGRHLRAGIELWLAEEDDFARRVAGDALCGTSLDLGRLRLDCAFFEWRMDGLVGAGRYDVLRRA